jgi:hypothetical protein
VTKKSGAEGTQRRALARQFGLQDAGFGCLFGSREGPAAREESAVEAVVPTAERSCALVRELNARIFSCSADDATPRPCQDLANGGGPSITVAPVSLAASPTFAKSTGPLSPGTLALR